jgi:hypothetical protein
MGSKYEWFVNPFQDFLFQAIILGADVSDEKLKENINSAFVFILEKHLINKNDVIYLDFDVINNNDHFKLVGMNSISALWLSGIIPDDTALVLENNMFELDDYEYRYNNRTNKLTYKKVR